MQWQALVALVLLLPAVAHSGRLAQLLKLPLISGYVFAGALAGPFVVGLLSHKAVNSLHLVDKCCLSVIALAAGAELHEADVSRIRGQVCRTSRLPATAFQVQPLISRRRRLLHDSYNAILNYS